MAQILAKIGRFVQVEAEGDAVAVLIALAVAPAFMLAVLAWPGGVRGADLVAMAAFGYTISALLIAYVTLVSFPIVPREDAGTN